MDLQTWQIIILTLIAGFSIVDGLMTPGFGLSSPLVVGWLAGAILGDVQTGLIVGGTVQMMCLGLGSYGGASLPDYMATALLGTVFAITSGQGAEFGIGIAIPIGIFLVQLDVLARFTNVFFQKKAEAAFHARKYKKITMFNLMGSIAWFTSRALPVFLGLIVGPEVVSALVEASPEWLINGLTVAGGLMPAVGLAILLKYLPLKENFQWAILGFVCIAYMNLPILAVSLIGLAVALVIFQNAEKTNNNGSQNLNYATGEGVILGDE